MGVDWYSCEKCGDTFPDCGDYVRCDSCGRHWCSDECAEAEGYIRGDDEDEEGCNFCRGEDVEDSNLLRYCLEALTLTRSECVKAYLKSLPQEG